MADRDTIIDVHLKSTADTSGVEKINAALGIVEKSEKQLATARAQFLSAAEAEMQMGRQAVEAFKRETIAREQAAKQTNLHTDAIQRLAEAAERTQKFFTPQVINPWVTASASATQATNLHTEAMKRAGEAAERTQKFFTPQAINPWVTASAGARVNLDNLHISQTRAAGSTRNMGNAMLQASRGLQDMQYGLAGAGNNLEGIASALGLGAGVAGMVTVLAVAVQQLGPVVVDWLKSLDTEGAKLDDLTAVLGRAAAAIKGEYSSNKENAKRISDEFTAALKKEKDALEASTHAIDQNQKMLAARNAVQKTADQQKLDSDLEDIKAQNLPKDQEAAAIAARKREALDAEKARADHEAQAGISGDADALTKQTQERNALQARQAALEKEKRAAAEHADLVKEQAKLEKAKQQGESYIRSRSEEAGPVPPEMQKKIDDNKKKLEANRARQKELEAAAPGGHVRGVDEINDNLQEVTPAAKAAAEKTAKDAQALRDKVEAERIAKIARDNTYQREAEKIAREQQGGVYDKGNLPLPKGALDQGPDPLPPPAAPGSTLPAPMLGPAELDPQRTPSAAPRGHYGPGDAAPEQGAPAAPTAPASALQKPSSEKWGNFIGVLDDLAAAAEKSGDKASAQKHRDKARETFVGGIDGLNRDADSAEKAGRLEEAAQIRAKSKEFNDELKRRQMLAGRENGQETGPGNKDERIGSGSRPKLPENSDLTGGGKQKLPQNSDLAKAAKAAAESNEAANQASLAHAQEATQSLLKMKQDSDKMKREMETLKSQVKGMRS